MARSAAFTAASSFAGPRSTTVTADGCAVARRPERALRNSTGTAVTVRSTGTGRISTVTIASRGFRSRTFESGTPIETVSITGRVAPRTLTGSVVASVTPRTSDAGPVTSTVAGSDVTRVTSNPGAGSSSMSGMTGTVREAVASNVNDSVGGDTCSTLMPVGTTTSPGK